MRKIYQLKDFPKMRINTKVIIDIDTNQVLERESFDYSGPVELAKHGDEKRRADQQMQQQNAMQKQAFDAQTATMAQIKSALGRYMTGSGEGFDPTQLALMQSQFMGQNASDFNSARSAVMSALASRGSGTGTMPVGGDYTRGLSGLYGAEASNLSSGLSNIKLQNLQQALTNRFNTASIFSGNAAALSNPINSFGQGASSALDQRIKVGLTPGFGANLMNSFASGLGGGLGAGISGGIGTAASKVGSGNWGW